MLANTRQLTRQATIDDTPKDVEALEAAGLLDRDKDGLRTEYDAFDVAMRIAL